ncbi:hypothetical protein GGI12_000967 [Dipsacomyces acuminosporus]|nr:hypothetical protein GGI12_000967 [Dipsacomyces acuminosporus]
MKILSTTAALAAVLATECLGYSFSAWSSTGYTGSQFSTTSSGTHRLGFYAKSYKFSSPFGDSCCIKFCANGRETGSSCPSRSSKSVASGNRFNKVVVGCGGTTLNC